MLSEVPMNSSAFIFRVKQLRMLEPEVGGNKILRNFGTSHPSTQRHTSKKKTEFLATTILQTTCSSGPPLWSSRQSLWLQIQRSRVRFPALPDFLSSSGSGTGSTQPREVN